MNKREWMMGKIGRGVLAICAVVCIAAAFIGPLGIPGLALGTAVTVNAPEYVEGTFNATIDVDSITNQNLNTGESFSSIQAAIDDLDTKDRQVIEVEDG